jgi:hypothetical protein
MYVPMEGWQVCAGVLQLLHQEQYSQWQESQQHSHGPSRLSGFPIEKQDGFQAGVPQGNHQHEAFREIAGREEKS